MPLPVNLFKEVFAEHTLEHFEFEDELKPLLAECWRVLRPGGIIRLSVPDAAAALYAYVNEDSEYFQAVRHYHPDWAVTWMLQLSFMFNQNGQHKFGCDAETMRIALESVGFEGVATRPSDPRRDLAAREHGSLLMQATKPLLAVEKVQGGGPSKPESR